MEAEDVAQALDVRLGRLGDVEPEEVVALELVAELLLVDLREAGDAQVNPARGIFGFEDVGLGRRHAGSVYQENLKIGPAGTGAGLGQPAAAAASSAARCSLPRRMTSLKLRAWKIATRAMKPSASANAASAICCPTE